MKHFCLVLAILASWHFLGQVRAAPLPEQAQPKANGPIRVLVPRIDKGEQTAIDRLKGLKFEVATVPWKEFGAASLKDIDVLFLPTQWAEAEATYQHFEKQREAIQSFVKSGKGLLVCQPNPSQNQDQTCTPQLLPYPITFQNSYNDAERELANLDPAHFITDDLPGADMPFPADPMIKVDKRWTILAKQKATDWASLAVCRFGEGRIVVQTANESPHATIPMKDEIVRRMVVWAARAPAK